MKWESIICPRYETFLVRGLSVNTLYANLSENVKTGLHMSGQRGRGYHET